MRAGHASAILLGLAALCGCADFRTELPSEIEADELLVGSTDGWFMSSCTSAVYRLSDATAQTLIEKGGSFLRGVAPPPGQSPTNPYTGWAETPMAGEGVYALNALNGCARDNPYARQIEAALRVQGSYFALTRNREGMMLVAPRARMAVFLYFG